MSDLLNILFSPKGRLNQKGYITGVLVCIVVQVGFMFAVSFLSPGGDSVGPGFLISLLGIILFCLIFWAGIVMAIKRFRDIDKSGWFCLLLLIPLIGLVVFVALLFIPGTPDKNKFGEPDRG
tara:strand:+ start:14626 stop:14991 length:366 start_codon:yes stop_codon:yes gene_type:complete